MWTGVRALGWRIHRETALEVLLPSLYHQIRNLTASAESSSEVPTRQKERLQHYLNKVVRASDCSLSDVWRVMYYSTKTKIQSEETLKNALEPVTGALLRRSSLRELCLCLHYLSLLHASKTLKASRSPKRSDAVSLILKEVEKAHRLEACDGAALTHILRCMATMHLLKHSQLIHLCVERIIKCADKLTEKQCLNLLQCLTQLSIPDKFALHQVSKQAVLVWKRIPTEEKLTMLDLWTQLGEEFRSYVQDALCDTFSNRQRHSDKFQPHHYAAVLLAMAKSSLHDQRRVMEHAMKQFLEEVKQRDVEGQTLSDIIWALGKLHYQNQTQIHALAKAAVRPYVLEQLTERALCRLMVGWALMELKEPEAIEIMIEEALVPMRLSAFEHQDLALLNWSIGKLNVFNLGHVDRLVQESSLTHRVRQYSDQQICLILQGWAWMGVRDFDAAHKLLREALSPGRIHQFETHLVSDLLCATGSLHVPRHKFYYQLCLELMQKRRIAVLKGIDVKKALLGCQLGDYKDVIVAHFFREVFDHWLTTQKLHAVEEAALQSIYALLKQFPYIEPVLIHHIGKEINGRKNDQLSL